MIASAASVAAIQVAPPAGTTGMRPRAIARTTAPGRLGPRSPAPTTKVGHTIEVDIVPRPAATAPASASRRDRTYALAAASSGRNTVHIEVTSTPRVAPASRAAPNSAIV